MLPESNPQRHKRHGGCMDHAMHTTVAGTAQVVEKLARGSPVVAKERQKKRRLREGAGRWGQALAVATYAD